MLFSEMNLHPGILQGLSEAGYLTATPVQEKTWRQIVVNGRDVTVQSQTGTGKTAAFLIPVFQKLLSEGTFLGSKALILAPTRELAVQIWEEAKLLGKHTSLRYGCVFGGVAYGQQEATLKAGVDILIGTPGRLQDFIDQKKVLPKEYGILVIDEADRLLDMGFFPDMQRIIRTMKPREERMTMLLSATISSRVSQLTWEYMNSPANIEVEAEQVTVDAIDQCLYHVSREEKMSILVGILRKEKPETAIVFCNTKRAAEEVAKRLTINELPANFIMGDLPQSKRLRIIQDMKDKKVPILVATDVAARGLHVDALDMVINYDLPEDPENYVHRIGRTARAGASGKARTLACERYVFGLEAIEKYINGKIPVAAVGEDIMGEDASKGMRIRLDSYDDGGSDRGGDRGGRGRGPSKDGGRRSQGERPPRGPRVETTRPIKPQATVPTQEEPQHVQKTERPRPERLQDEKRHGERRQKKSEHGASAEARPRHATMAKRKADGSVEERLAYYKQKYGEDFVATPGTKEGAKKQGPNQAQRQKSARPRVVENEQRRSEKTTQESTSPVKPKEANKPARKGIIEWFKNLFRGS